MRSLLDGERTDAFTSYATSLRNDTPVYVTTSCQLYRNFTLTETPNHDRTLLPSEAYNILLLRTRSTESDLEVSSDGLRAYIQADHGCPDFAL